MRNGRHFVIWIGILLLVVGCGQNGSGLPTAVLQPIEQILPVETETAVLPTATLPPTAVPEATLEPTITATIDEQSELETAVVTTPDAHVLTITQPTAGDDVFVAESVTIDGTIMPIPTEALVVRVLALGGDELTRETAVIDKTTGEWSATLTIPPQIVGSAQIMAQVENQPDAVAIQINLAPNGDSSERYIVMHRPLAGVTAIVGHAVLFSGDVAQPLGETVTMAIQSADCHESWTSNSISLPNGRWQGWSVLPRTIAAGTGCAIAFTGERGQETSREVRMPITILDETDDLARSLQLGNAGDLLFTAGEPAYFYGVAIQAPNNQVTVQLVADDAQSSSPIVVGMADVNSYGYWEINLDIPAGTPQNQALLIVSMGEDDSYREVRKVVFVQAAGSGE